MSRGATGEGKPPAVAAGPVQTVHRVGADPDRPLLPGRLTDRSHAQLAQRSPRIVWCGDGRIQGAEAECGGIHDAEPPAVAAQPDHPAPIAEDGLNGMAAEACGVDGVVPVKGKHTRGDIVNRRSAHCPQPDGSRR